ncbi:MAG: hypothetical protein PWP31_1413 [Clostridia bacterium]|nr:hypothetical protein [Clostridia bacterium]
MSKEKKLKTNKDRINKLTQDKTTKKEAEAVTVEFFDSILDRCCQEEDK